MERLKDYDISYKVLLIGESGVGKTCLLRSLVGERFTTNTYATIGIDFKKEIFNVDGARVMLELWDTAGQERFRTFTKSHLRGTQGILLVYDITRQETFRQLDFWMKAIEKLVDNDEPPPKLIIGNKSDLSDSREVSRESAEKLVREHYERGYEETSCKTGENVRESFHKLAEILVETYHPLLTDAFKGKVTDYNKPKVAKRDSITLSQKDLKKSKTIIAVDPSLKSIHEEPGSKCC